MESAISGTVAALTKPSLQAQGDADPGPLWSNPLALWRVTLRATDKDGEPLERELGLFFSAHCLHSPIRVITLSLDRELDNAGVATDIARMGWADGWLEHVAEGAREPDVLEPPLCPWSFADLYELTDVILPGGGAVDLGVCLLD